MSLVAATLVVLLALGGDGRSGSPQVSRDHVDGRFGGGAGGASGPYRGAQSELEAARALRLAGREDDALAAYRRAALSPEGRVDHRRRARYEAARLGLRRGEASAVVELEGLVREGLAPHELARTAVALRRAADDLDPGSSARARAVAHACTTELERLACVLDLTGERARNWLRTIDSSSNSASDASVHRTSVEPPEHARASRAAPDAGGLRSP